MLDKQIKEFVQGRDLGEGNAEAFLDSLLLETEEGRLREIFLAWNDKGIESREIFAIAKVMRARSRKIRSQHENFVDIVGTGGGRNKTFNVSTAAAFVAAASGVPVAKHGNKAATSRSGSSDVLCALGIDPAMSPAAAERCLNELSLCFMFAPNFHRLSPALAAARRSLGFPTIFNCVGPLCNPAEAPNLLIGVWDRELVEKMAIALSKFGTRRSWIVHGLEGIDEISARGPTLVAEVTAGAYRAFELSPKEFGIDPMSNTEFACADADASASMIRRIFAGKEENSFAERLVLLNAAAAVYLTGQARSPEAAFEVVRASLREGRPTRKLEELAAVEI
jgi:anthranilate phosphoribosyltransferase